jgi:hypothetical protein
MMCFSGEKTDGRDASKQNLAEKADASKLKT